MTFSFHLPWETDLMSTVLGIFSSRAHPALFLLTWDLNKVFTSVDFPRPLWPDERNQRKDQSEEIRWKAGHLTSVFEGARCDSPTTMILKSKPVFMVFFLICSMMVSMPMYPSRVDPPPELWEPPWPWTPPWGAGWPPPWAAGWPKTWLPPWFRPWPPMGTGMALGGGAEVPPPPKPGAWGGKELEGEGMPTFGGLAGTAGLGLTSGGTMSDMSVEENMDRGKWQWLYGAEEVGQRSSRGLVLHFSYIDEMGRSSRLKGQSFQLSLRYGSNALCFFVFKCFSLPNKDI